tara:strand:- start:2988 stop:3248 length:261 start_codon:yes stop_codon:yes gene_type:complete
MDVQVYTRLLILEKHLELAYDEIRHENYEEATRLLLNALSTTGQLQEILETKEEKEQSRVGEEKERGQDRGGKTSRPWVPKRWRKQ